MQPGAHASLAGLPFPHVPGQDELDAGSDGSATPTRPAKAAFRPSGAAPVDAAAAAAAAVGLPDESDEDFEEEEEEEETEEEEEEEEREPVQDWKRRQVPDRAFGGNDGGSSESGDEATSSPGRCNMPEAAVLGKMLGRV